MTDVLRNRPRDLGGVLRAFVVAQYALNDRNAKGQRLPGALDVTKQKEEAIRDSRTSTVRIRSSDSGTRKREKSRTT